MQQELESNAVGLEQEEGELLPDQGRGEPTSGIQSAWDPSGIEGQLGKMVEREVNRRFQSAKDKRWAQLEKQYRELSELRGVADALLGSDQGSANASEEQAGLLGERIRELAELPGINGNEDARALILRNMQVDDLPAYVKVIEDLLQMTLGDLPETDRKSGASAAMAVTPGGGDAPGDLRQAYRRRKQLLRAGDVNGLMALKREFRQKGLDVF